MENYHIKHIKNGNIDEESEDKENKKVSNFVMVTASLFDLSQVEKIEA